MENDSIAGRLNNYGRYPKKEWCPPGEWCKNHILPQHGEERAYVVILDDCLNSFRE